MEQTQKVTVTQQTMEKNVCKVKGFTLNYENSQHINQQSLKQLIEGKKKRITTVKENAITRDSKTKQLVNKYQEKDLKLDYDKRWVAAAGGDREAPADGLTDRDCVETFPWGY